MTDARETEPPPPNKTPPAKPPRCPGLPGLTDPHPADYLTPLTSTHGIRLCRRCHLRLSTEIIRRRTR
jgi:hypothetical protein